MGIFLLIAAGLLTGFVIFRLLGIRLPTTWLLVILAIVGIGFIDLGLVDSPLGLHLPGLEDDPYAELGEMFIAWLFGLPFALGGLAGILRARQVARRSGGSDAAD